MSMHEAIRKLRGYVPWLSDRDIEEQPPPAPPTPLEFAEGLVALAKMPGEIERTSATWNAVARWAAQELIVTHIMLETATDERAAALRARAKTLRDLLVIDERTESNTVIEDQGPYVP